MRFELPPGYTASYLHDRRPVRFDRPVDDDAFPMGAHWFATRHTIEARVFDTNDTLVASGVSILHPTDEFKFELGERIALGRALRALNDGPQRVTGISSLDEFLAAIQADLAKRALEGAESAARSILPKVSAAVGVELTEAARRIFGGRA